MIYLIDSNIFISTHRVSHLMDIHPSFWNQLEKILQRDDVFSIDKIKDELEYFEDDLKVWIKSNINKSFWQKTDVAIEKYADIQNWAHAQNYYPITLKDFANSSKADPFLIAYSIYLREKKSIQSTIVTLETSSPDSKKIIKIPDVCIAFGIEYVDNNEFFRQIGATFKFRISLTSINFYSFKIKISFISRIDTNFSNLVHLK